jgi:hypothetical protein
MVGAIVAVVGAIVAVAIVRATTGARRLDRRARLFVVLRDASLQPAAPASCDSAPPASLKGLYELEGALGATQRIFFTSELGTTWVASPQRINTSFLMRIVAYFELTGPRRHTDRRDRRRMDRGGDEQQMASESPRNLRPELRAPRRRSPGSRVRTGCRSTRGRTRTREQLPRGSRTPPPIRVSRSVKRDNVVGQSLHR